MAMGHDKDDPSMACLYKFFAQGHLSVQVAAIASLVCTSSCVGIGCMYSRDIGRYVRGESIGPRIDPAHPERQRRQGHDEGAPDMAGAEQQHRRARVPSRAR